jgi:hypothetical protein
MALSPQLLNFKSSGVYRLEFDKSQTANINVETLRLVVGHSRKGPYNTPVLIDSVEAFENTFGTIDRSLEKRRMYFHRSALEALTRGPILALNVANFTAVDVTSSQRLVTNGSIHSTSSEGAEDNEYTSFFDNDKFMVPSDAAVLATLGTTIGDTNLLNFVNIKQDSITIIARQAQDVKEFDMTAREWYGEGNVPSYLNDFDRLSDFMIDVFVFKGEFNAALIKNDPIFGAYFNEDGLDKTKLAQFANLRQVSLIAQYTGSVLPGFKDLEGRNLYIETMINDEARRTGLFCAVDEDAVLNETVLPNGTVARTKIDLVGHDYYYSQDYELLSHVVKQTAIESIVTLPSAAENADIPVATNIEDPAAAALSVGDTVLTITGADLTSSLVGTFYLLSPTGIEPHVAATAALVTGDTVITAVSAINTAHAGPLTNFDIYDIAEVTPLPVTTAVVGNVLTIFNLNVESSITNDLHTEQYLTAASGGEYVQIDVIFFNGTDTTITASGDISLIYNALDTTTNAITIKEYVVTTPRISENTLGNTYATQPGTTFTFTELSGVSPINPGDYVNSDTAGRLARVNRVAKTGTTYTAYCDTQPSSVWSNYIVHSFESASSHYKTFVLKGAVIAPKSISNSLAAITGGNGLYDALVDKDLIDFRYVVDTFGSFDETGILNKTELSQLAKDRQNASAILNAPTVAEFKLSTNPSFKDIDGVFKTAYIETGGNLDKNPTAIYTLPSILEGANYAFFYGPGLIVSDGGKDIIVPPAAYISNNFIDKYTSALPWSIVAGPRRGVVSGANVKGTEYSFDKKDRDVLEPFGINPIVFQRGVGLTILGNKTAQQSIKSALSSAHVREALIYIEDGMANILKDYVFEFNNVQTRLEIKTLADSFMESIKQDGGVYAYKNVMDQTNNTNEVIDNNIGIIDTFVEPVKGLEIVVHRTTILNTGEIQSGNL